MQRLMLAPADLLLRVQKQHVEGKLVTRDGSPVTLPFTGMLVTEDGRCGYLIRTDIVHLVPEQAIIID